MKEKLALGFLLFFSFLMAFFITTALTDVVARYNGYYSVGIQDERSLENDFR